MSTTLTAAPAFTAEGFEAFLSTREGEPDWLTQYRRDAFEYSESVGWPLRRSEEWIRTDIRAFKLEKFTPPATCQTSAVVPDVHQLRTGIEPVGVIETMDSAVASESLDESLASKGVVFGSLDRLCREQPELVQQYLGKLFNAKHDRFAALHAAFWSGGQFLYVPRNVTIEQPLYIGSVLSDGGVDTSHTLIVLDEGAEATVIHECNSVDQSAGGLHLGAVELLQGPESNLRYVNVQEWGHKTYHFAQQKGAVDRDGNLQWTIAAMGSGLTKVNQSVDLVGKGAYSQVNGVMFTEGRQHLSYHTEQRHVAPVVPQRLPLQVGPAGPISHGVAWDDQGRQGRAEDRRLPTQRQPRAVRPSPSRLDSGFGDRSRRCPLHPRQHDCQGRRRADLLRHVSWPDA